MSRWSRGWLLLPAWVSGLVACQGGEPTEEQDAPALAPSVSSPNAHILPAPLSGQRRVPPREKEDDAMNASPPPAPPRPFPSDAELAPQLSVSREGGLFELRGEFVWPEIESRSVPLPSEEPAEVLARSSRRTVLTTRPELRLLLTPSGHLVVEFAAPTFALPPGTQLRALRDRFGHVVVWPDRRSYRVIPRGALRAVLQERRVDVSPLLVGESEESASGRRLGLPTMRRDVQGPLGRLVLESGRSSGSGEGGVLLCRLLLELGRIQSSAELCPSDELPLEAHYVWDRGGEITFRILSLVRHGVWPAAEAVETFDIPPPMPIFKPGELPPEPSPLLWPSEVEALLFGASEESAELELHNPERLPLYVVADRLPLARVPALGRFRWVTSRRSRSLSVRDFLGETAYAARSIEVPGVFSLSPEAAPEDSEVTSARLPR